jgi:hypothetical protein
MFARACTKVGEASSSGTTQRPQQLSWGEFYLATTSTAGGLLSVALADLESPPGDFLLLLLLAVGVILQNFTDEELGSLVDVDVILCRGLLPPSESMLFTVFVHLRSITREALLREVTLIEGSAHRPKNNDRTNTKTGTLLAKSTTGIGLSSGGSVTLASMSFFHFCTASKVLTRVTSNTTKAPTASL